MENYSRVRVMISMIALVSMLLIVSGCGKMKKRDTAVLGGGLVGASAGAAVGAGVSATGSKVAGAAAGGIIGAVAGGLIGHALFSGNNEETDITTTTSSTEK
ncbi:hypothetical protein KAU11_02245 [Candidatus Babeliales bacterium]|nr:hypothetical protein [Candidatus Babeliales bacterium]